LISRESPHQAKANAFIYFYGGFSSHLLLSPFSAPAIYPQNEHHQRVMHWCKAEALLVLSLGASPQSSPWGPHLWQLLGRPLPTSAGNRPAEQSRLGHRPHGQRAHRWGL